MEHWWNPSHRLKAETMFIEIHNNNQSTGGKLHFISKLSAAGTLENNKAHKVNKNTNWCTSNDVTFCQRNYCRRKDRITSKTCEDNTSAMDALQLEDKRVPRPPDTPKGHKAVRNTTAEPRLLPALRGGKLPPLSVGDSSSTPEGSSTPPAANEILSKKARRKFIDAVPKQDSDSLSEVSCTSSGDGSDYSSEQSQEKQINASQSNNKCKEIDKVDGLFSKKTKKKQREHRVETGKELNGTLTNEAQYDLGDEKATETDLLRSYEDYMREIATKEDNDTMSSDEYSVSSLSNDSEDESETVEIKDKPACSPKFSSATDGLYSLPLTGSARIKQDTKEDSMKNFLGQSGLHFLNMSEQNNYVTMDNFPPLRSQSDPNLKSGSINQLEMLMTHSYLTPADKNFIAQLYASNCVRIGQLVNDNSKPENPALRQRPLPPIPLSHEPESTDDEPMYETVETCVMCKASGKKQVGNSGKRFTESASIHKKLTFKSVANTVINVMPRLTTQEARNRRMDRALADIRQYFPDGKLKIFLGTWNMKGTKVLPGKMDDFLFPPESIYVQDIYAIGSQEGTPFRREWELRLQETLGPSHVLIHSCNFGVLQLSLFVRREIIWYCTGLEQDSVATRMGHKIKTKGALAVSFTLFGTSLLFINSHFTSDEGKLKDRLTDYRNICKSLTNALGVENRGSSDDVTSRFDRVFWFGDFNFRVSKSRKDVDKLISKNLDKKPHIIKELLKHDQLLDMYSKGKLFQGFREHPIHFMPTYKYDVNTDSYDTSAKRRVPSWTDRILIRSPRPDQIGIVAYNSCEPLKNSDHRPVYCIVDVTIEAIKSKYTVPGGRFDRDIYIEANLRRNAPTGSQHASNVCIIL